MKKLYFLIIFLFPFSSFAQYQSIFGQNQTSWNNSVYHQAPGFTMFVNDSTFVTRDTVINSFAYKILEDISYFQGDAIGPCLDYGYSTFFIREDTVNGLIWYFKNDSLNEKLLYDFSLTEGDTFIFLGNQSLIVDSIKVINNRKHIYFNQQLAEEGNENLIFIEGVGSNNGILYAENNGYCIQIELLCMYKDNQLVYIHSYPDIEYDGCNVVIDRGLNLQEFDIESGFKIYPNPASDLLNIEYVNAFLIDFSYEILDIFGRKILFGKIHSSIEQISIDKLESGLYFCSIMKGNMKVETQKMVVQKN